MGSDCVAVGYGYIPSGVRGWYNEIRNNNYSNPGFAYKAGEIRFPSQYFIKLIIGGVE